MFTMAIKVITAIIFCTYGSAQAEERADEFR
jgi:hypothetical protein